MGERKWEGDGGVEEWRWVEKEGEMEEGERDGGGQAGRLEVVYARIMGSR